MTMIASTVQANTFFDNVGLVPTETRTGHHPDHHQKPNTARSYANRTTGDRSYGATDFSLSASNFGHNIWQSDWQPNSLDQSFDHVAKNSTKLSSASIGERRPQPPTLALPNIKASAHVYANNDRRSPIGYEREARRDSEPLSARSRSQHESNTLTPTSLSSDSELSTQPSLVSQDQRWHAATGLKPGATRKPTHIWPNAPEFRPTLPLQKLDINALDQYESPRLVGFSTFNSSSSHMPSYGLENSWYARESRNLPVTRNDFRPVLSSNSGTDYSNQIERDHRRTDNRVHDLTNSFARLGMENSQRSGTAGFGSQNVVAGRSQLQQHNTRDRQQSTHHVSDTWNDAFYKSGGNTNLPDFPTSRLDRNARASQAPRRFDTSDANHDDTLSNAAHPSYSHVSLASIPQLKKETTDYRGLDSHSWPHFYERDTYDGSFAPGMVADYRNFSASITSSLSAPYATYEPTDPTSSMRPQPDAVQITRSPLLEEFRAHGKNKKYELKDIFGHIVEFSGDQLGSRFIQHQLEGANSEEKDRVFSEIACDSRQLMTDLFGNYVIQKLFEHGNQSQKKVLASHMKGHIVALSMQQYGCRVVQKALEHILTDQQASLIRELDGYVLKVVDNQHGNHVIQKAIECIRGEHVQFIVDAHRGHVHALSKHAYGCRVIQRMLEHCQGPAKRMILDELHQNIGDLIQDPFGNYVVQHVIVNGEPQDRKPVINKVQSKLLENATHKFASNVVEKALDYADEEQCQAMLRALTGRDEQGQSRVLKLLGHQYGNYVIQKSAAHLHGHALQMVLEDMEQYLMQLRRVSSGKQISALEGSVRDARQRLFHQRHQNQSISNAPIEPSRHTLTRR